MKYGIALTLVGCLLNFAAYGNYSHQPRGQISNEAGKECWFQQRSSQESHFQTIPGQTATLVFDDPRCMVADGVPGMVNRMLINNRIVKPYSHPDAAFKTKDGELYPSSALQVRGLCIQSAKYPGIGVVVEYLTSDGYIRAVKHGSALQGCRR